MRVVIYHLIYFHEGAPLGCGVVSGVVSAVAAQRQRCGFDPWGLPVGKLHVFPHVSVSFLIPPTVKKKHALELKWQLHLVLRCVCEQC